MNEEIKKECSGCVFRLENSGIDVCVILIQRQTDTVNASVAFVTNRFAFIALSGDGGSGKQCGAKSQQTKHKYRRTHLSNPHQ